MIFKKKTTNFKDREDDIRLIERILAGEERALLEFYNRFSPKVLSFIRSKVENINDGEEILQDSLMACLEAMRDFSGLSSLSTFLFAITRNKIVDYYRKRKIKQVLFSKLPELENLVGELLRPDEELEGKLLKEKIRKTIEHLDKKYQMVLILKYIYGLSVGEMAEKLAESIKTIESRLFRARKAFMKIYGE